jgi:hypothetical protein
MVALLLITITAAFAAVRLAGHKGAVYKAFAHCYVGWLFGVAMAAPDPDGSHFFGLLAWGLAGVEVLAFLYQRVYLKRILHVDPEAPGAGDPLHGTRRRLWGWMPYRSRRSRWLSGEPVEAPRMKPDRPPPPPPEERP